MKNLSNFVPNRFLAFLAGAAAALAPFVAKAGLNVPYAPDANTMHLWHFNDPLSSFTEADAAGTTNTAITLTNYGLGVTSTGTGTAGNPPYTNIFLTSAPVIAGISEYLQILPGDGNVAPGDSHAMAAGPEDMTPTNFCNPSSGAFTFEALVNPQGNIFSSAAGSGEWEIFCGDNGVGTRGWQFRLQNAAVPVMDFNFINASGGSSVNQTFSLPASGSDALSTTQWYHVAVTFTGNTPTNSDPAGVMTFYWTLLDPNRNAADVLGSITNSALGTIGGTPSPAVGGSQRTTHGVGNEGGFQGLITEVRVSAVCRSATSMAFNTNAPQSALNVPYAVDADTMHLWHFHDGLDSDTASDAIASTNAAITLTNYGLGDTSTGTGTAGSPPYTNIFQALADVAPGVYEVLNILPGDGGAALGDSHAMAAGPEDMAPTNFCNASSGAFTFEALVNPQGDIFSSAAGSGEWEIFCGDNGVGTRGWQFRLQNAAVPVMDFNFIDATGGNSVNQTFALPSSGPDALATNQWYHVAVSYTGNTPTNSDSPGLMTFYWTLLDPTRTNADVLGSITNSALGTIGGTPSPAVGGSQRTTHGVGNEGGFQGMLTEVRVSSVCRSASSFVFSTNSVGASPVFPKEPPASVFIGYGQSLTVNALVSGSPAPSLQWQQTNASGGWINVSGQTNNTLDIADATFAAGTAYRLSASNYVNGFAEVSYSTIVNVSVGAAFSEVFNTGTDANNDASTNLAGATDLHYTLSDSADAINTGPATSVWLMTAYPIAAESGGFANIDNVSQWIGPTWNNGGATYTSPQGNYTYRTHFLADAVDTTKPAKITGTWWANTTGANILLNGLSLGISTGVTNGGTTSSEFVITNGFVPGLNTLDFVAPCVNPNGSYPEAAVRVEISSALGQALGAGLPQIVTQPAANQTVTDSSVESGASALFSVVATGRPPLSYQWYAAGAGAISGATSRTLSFANPTAGGQGTNFTVVVSNGSGSVTSSVATLTVTESVQAPLAPNFTYYVYTNATLNIDETELLLAASDPNSLAMTITLNSVTNGTLTEVEANGSAYTYMPNAGFTGADGFTYTVADAYGSANGTVFIYDVAPSLPTKMQASLSGHNLVFSGTGGAPNGSFVILATADLTLPTTSWTTVATGNFDGSGGFSVNLPIDAGTPAQFYTMELP